MLSWLWRHLRVIDMFNTFMMQQGIAKSTMSRILTFTMHFLRSLTVATLFLVNLHKFGYFAISGA